MNRTKRKYLIQWFLGIVLAIFVFLMLRISLTYSTLNTDIGFLRIKQQYLENTFWLTSFFIHSLTSIFCLLAGFTQFSKLLLKNRPHIHRGFGKLYVYFVLLLSAPTGLVLGVYANGRLPSRIGFVLLALLWFGFTLKALLQIKNKKISSHRRFMIRSYALALSAITLRLWKFGLANTIAPNPLELYQMVTWLGFVPNMIIAEIIIWQSSRKIAIPSSE